MSCHVRPVLPIFRSADVFPDWDSQAAGLSCTFVSLFRLSAAHLAFELTN